MTKQVRPHQIIESTPTETSEQRRRVFLTGATGAMGLSAVKTLTEAGHQVVGLVRSRQGANALKELGVIPVVGDLFDETFLREAIRGSDVIAHFATSIPSGFSATRPRAWRANDRLRREGTVALIAIAEAVGIRRVIFESISLAYPDLGDQWIDETVELKPRSSVMDSALEAERMLAEFQLRGGEPVCLRFGRLYGPGRASNDMITAVRERSMPLIGNGDNFVSSIHVDDVGSAVSAAVDVAPGAYNIVDDEPLTQRALMETVAESLQAPQPRQLPYAIARLMLGHIANVLTVSQRVSNCLFCKSTAWRPVYGSAVVGWPAVLEAKSVFAEVPAT